MSNMNPLSGGVITNRRIDWFHHESLPEWGYTVPQTDTFALLHTENEAEDVAYPLYVVFHSAGHDVYSCVACTWQPGNHDIYHAPADMYALYLDCRQHMNDWWWGGNNGRTLFEESRAGVRPQPVENRCMATIQWVMEHFPIDRARVYGVGNSMGGSGVLGVALCRGDIFAAIKANVPAGVRHAADRCALDVEAPEGFQVPDPPVLVDYSAQNDDWSRGHELLYRTMREKKYPVLGYWGNFGHANNNALIRETNDLIHSFDIFSVRLDEAYPVFTNASTDDALPWADDGAVVHDQAGQVNSFFRWGKACETADSVSIPLRLLRQDEWESRVTFPTTATADVTLRRLQRFRVAPGAQVAWECGEQSGQVAADAAGLVTVPGVTVCAQERVLTLRRV